MGGGASGGVEWRGMTKVARGSRLKVSKIVQFAQSSLRDTIPYCKSNYIRTPQCRRYWSTYRENDSWMYIAVRIFFPPFVQ